MYHLVDINVRNTNKWWQDFDIATQQPQHTWHKEHKQNTTHSLYPDSNKYEHNCHVKGHLI